MIPLCLYRQVSERYWQGSGEEKKDEAPGGSHVPGDQPAPLGSQTNQQTRASEKKKKYKAAERHGKKAITRVCQSACDDHHWNTRIIVITLKMFVSSL